VKLLEKLTPEQREGFERALKTGKIYDLIELWEPWWKNVRAR
jgi:hypothetical protein